MKYTVTIEVEIDLDEVASFDFAHYLEDSTPNWELPDAAERVVAESMAFDLIERGEHSTARHYAKSVTARVAPRRD